MQPTVTMLKQEFQLTCNNTLSNETEWSTVTTVDMNDCYMYDPR